MSDHAMTNADWLEVAALWCQSDDPAIRLRCADKIREIAAELSVIDNSPDTITITMPTLSAFRRQRRANMAAALALGKGDA